jgi:hypothetical protein
VDIPSIGTNQPKLIWGCKGKGIELNTEVLKAKNVEKSSLSADYFGKFPFFLPELL